MKQYGYFVEEEEQKKKREAQEEAERERVAAQKAEDQAQRAAEVKAERIRIETEQFNSLPEAERFVCELNEAVEVYLENTVLKGRKDAVSQRINRIIKSKGWSQSEREMGFQVVQCAYSVILSGKKLEKKLTKAREWLEAENGE